MWRPFLLRNKENECLKLQHYLTSTCKCELICYVVRIYLNATAYPQLAARATPPSSAYLNVDLPVPL